jgi:4-amino-4-deoxy-L-arabinose transferase-like glycosyltransferase
MRKQHTTGSLPPCGGGVGRGGNTNSLCSTSPSPYALLWLCIVAARLLALGFWPYDLYPDEAQYWWWAQTPDFGYYSKPPIVAWVIAASTALLGDGPSAIRLPALIAHALTSLILGAFTRHLSGQPHLGWLAAVTYLTLPAVTLSSMILSTDPFLLLFWSAACLSFYRAVETGENRWWIAAGLAGGGALLSKYNAAMFAVTALGYLLTSQKRRRWFARPQPYLAAALALCLFAPNLWWNAAHDWVSFRHTGDNATGEGLGFYPLSLLRFIGAQAGVFGPLLLPLLGVLIWKHRQSPAPYLRFALWSILPLLAMILWVSLTSRAHANWAAPIYSMSTVLVVVLSAHGYGRPLEGENPLPPGEGRVRVNINADRDTLTPALSRRERESFLRWLHRSLILHTALAFLFLLYPLVDSWMLTHTGLDPFKRLKGWQALGTTVEQQANAYPQAGILVETRKLAAALMYYAPSARTRLVKWNADHDVDDHFDLTRPLTHQPGGDFLLVGKGLPSPEIKAFFVNAIIQSPPPEWGRDREGVMSLHLSPSPYPPPIKGGGMSRMALSTPLFPSPSQDYHVTLLTGFQGYR